MKRYELNIELLENGVVIDHQTVYTHAENLDRAQRNIAWRMVVKDNPEAEYPELAVRFEDGRVIDGGKKNSPMPLYIVLMHDLHKHGAYVDEAYAKQLRQEYAVNKNNYDKKLAQIVDRFKAEENTKNESANNAQKEEKEEEMKMEKEIETTVANCVAEAEAASENAVPDMLEAIAALEEEYPENIVTIDEQEKLFWKNNKALMKVIADKPFSEKYLYGKVFTILQYNHVDVVLIEGQENRFLHLNFNYSDIELPNKSAIDFGRQVWSEISEIGLDSSRVKNVRDQLTALFTNNKGKQETTDIHKDETVENKVAPANDKQKEERNMTIEDLCENAINAAAKTPDRFNKNTAILVGVKAVNKEDKSISDVKVGLNIRLWQDKENENFFRGKLFTPKGVEIGKVFWDIQKPYLPMLKKTGEAKYGTYMYKCSNELNVDFTDPNALAAWNRNQMILAVAKAFNQFGIHVKNTSGRTANVTTCYKEIPTVQTISSTAATPPVQGNPWAAYIK